MDESQGLPKYSAGQLADFVGDLRALLFKRKSEAAAWFNLNHTTIGRYESLDKSELRAPLGYLASLAFLFVERWGADETDTFKMRKALLEEVNKAIRKEYFQEERPFRDWVALQAVAQKYLLERRGNLPDGVFGKERKANDVFSPLGGAGDVFAPGAPFLAPPLPPQGIFGRQDALNQMIEMLGIAEDGAQEVAPLALRGMAGIGKTTLAIALTRQSFIARRFPDGVLWTALGLKPSVRLHLDTWGRALGVDLLPERDELACQEHLRDALYRRKVLIVVDDVWSSAQGSFFLIGGPGCRTIFTTRESPVAYDLATRERTVRVDVLKPEAALGLLKRLAPDVVASDEKSAMRLCERLEFLPLGLTLAGRLLAIEADIPARMQRLVGELIERRESRMKLLQPAGRLGLDEEEPVSIRAILGMSVERLDKLDQDRFAMLSVFGGEPLTWKAAPVAEVWECSMEEAEATISRLMQRGLVEARGERYWMHALLADYAAELREERGL